MLILTSIALPLVKEYYSDPPDVHKNMGTFLRYQSCSQTD